MTQTKAPFVFEQHQVVFRKSDAVPVKIGMIARNTEGEPIYKARINKNVPFQVYKEEELFVPKFHSGQKVAIVKVVNGHNTGLPEDYVTILAVDTEHYLDNGVQYKVEFRNGHSKYIDEESIIPE